MTQAHALLADWARGRPARILANLIGAPERTVRGWFAGRMPLWHYRDKLERLAGIPWPAWQVDAEPSRTAPPGNSVGGLETKGCRFSRQIGSKSETVTDEGTDGS